MMVLAMLTGTAIAVWLQLNTIMVSFVQLGSVYFNLCIKNTNTGIKRLVKDVQIYE